MRNRTTQIRARKLRNQSTDAERLIWQHLRQKQINGFRFRRQFPIDAYIVDFACIEAKLVVELDGGQHQEQVAHDTRRDAQISNQGYRVWRFWNNQVFAGTTAVLEAILKELLMFRPHPDLPPQAEEGTS